MPEDVVAVPAARRLEDIALDLMKFIAVTTNYGKGAASTGFQAKAAKGEEKSEEYAENLLQLYRRCLQVVESKKT